MIQDAQLFKYKQLLSLTNTILGWCLTAVRSEGKEEEKKGKECNNISYTDPKRQEEENLINCPDNQAYFFVVAAAFIGGLVVSYVVLQFIIKCSQIGAPAAKKKGEDKKKEEKNPKEKKEKTKEEATSSTGANGGVATKAQCGHVLYC